MKGKAYENGVKLYLAGKHPQLRRLIEAGTAGVRDVSLNSCEKSLLRSRLLIKQKKLALARKILESTATPTRYLAAEKSFLLGNILFLMAEYEAAITHYDGAARAYHDVGEKRGAFLSFYNQSVGFEKIGHLQLRDHYLKLARAHRTLPEDDALLLRTEAIRAHEMGDAQLVRKKLADIALLDPQLPWIQQLENATVAADLSIQLGELTLARTHLQTVLREKTHFNYLRARFDSALLDLPADAADFLRCRHELSENAELLTQWKIINHIRSGEVSALQTQWQALRGMRPSSFGELFDVIDPLEKNSAFGRTLAHYALTQIKSEPIATDTAAAARNRKILKLGEILAQARMPIRREELIEKIWETPYSPDLDMRFYKLMERFKKESRRKVLNVNRAYLLT